ncbi:sugar ABC transporter substrate-binding protein [Treponema sp.]|uniref:sugar ABC transporter substrate-binding protein n=1 Tax=Treponema sp. TaxID=166 RepID=UPI003F0D1856
MKIKKYAVLFFGSALILFSGCEKKSGSVPRRFNKHQISLTVWESLDGPDVFIKQAAQKYSELHPNIEVNFVNVEPNISVAQLKEDAPKGVGPDLFTGAHDNLGVLVSGGFILPTENPEDVKKQVLGSCSRALTYNGKMYGYPVSAETYSLFYNRSLISDSEVPSSWEKLAEWVENFNAHNPGKLGFVMDVANAYYTFIFTTSNDNRLFGQFGTEASRSNLNTPDSVHGMKFFQSLRSVVGLPSSEMTTAKADAAFQAGNAALHITGPWNIKNFSDAGVQFGVASLPSLPGESEPSASFSGTRAVFVSAFSDHPEEAADFARFLITPEMQQLRFKLTGAMPSINTNVNSQYIAGFLKQLEYAFPMPSVPEMGQYWTVMNSASARIWDGASVEQELNRADMQISR